MSNCPLVSVVVLTYNQEDYIEQTLDYILAQKTVYDYEIIIGEDCSTDNTRDVVLQYQRQYPEQIQIITSEKNVGLLENYYRTVKAARGKYIAGCAGDDYWHNPDKLQKQVQFLEENQEYGMVHSDADILKEDENRLIQSFHLNSRMFYDNSEDVLEALFLGDYPVVACTAVYRKEYFDRYFDLEELKRNDILMEDMPLWINIAAHSKIYYMAESTITHREMSGTITNPKSIEKKLMIWQSCLRCFLFYYEIYKDRFVEHQVNPTTIQLLFNQRFQKLAMGMNCTYLVRKYYNDIVRQAGRSYLTLRDHIRYWITYVPFGTRIYNFTLRSYYHLREIISGIPRR